MNTGICSHQLLLSAGNKFKQDCRTNYKLLAIRKIMTSVVVYPTIRSLHFVFLIIHYDPRLGIIIIIILIIIIEQYQVIIRITMMMIVTAFCRTKNQMIVAVVTMILILIRMSALNYVGANNDL